MTERFLLAASLELCNVGKDFSHLPPHITIVPPFRLDTGRMSDLDRELADRLSEEAPLHIVGRQLAEYGSAEYPVTVREVSGIAFGVHAACLALVKHFGGRFDEKHTAVGWSPHVTDTAALAEGEERVITDVQLFRYQPNGDKRVVAIYETLRGKHDEAAA